MPYPFEATQEELEAHIDDYVDSVFGCLESGFLVMPKGTGFVEYAEFEHGYEKLKQSTAEFTDLAPETLLDIVLQTPISLVVLRSILGLSPPEWGYITSQRTGIPVTQGTARVLDRRARCFPLKPLNASQDQKNRLRALLTSFHDLIIEQPADLPSSTLHRLRKADTADGIEGIRTAARLGIPYAMLLYERFLGRPFATHRDSISEMKGDTLETAVEDVLSQSGITYRKTKRASRVTGFDQAPDFIVPSEFNPQIVIEAKITEDDGTARDKVTRIQHLAELSRVGGSGVLLKYQVVACIDGRGFGVRREDMRKILLATQGKVFTMRTLSHLVEGTKLRDFRSIKSGPTPGAEKSDSQT